MAEPVPKFLRAEQESDRKQSQWDAKHGIQPLAVRVEARNIDGAALLNSVKTFVRRFCVLPTEHDLVAVTLWAALAHMVEHFHTTPRLSAQSAEPSSGKTRLLEILNLLVPNPMFVFSASCAAIFRTLASQRTTLLFDEVDCVFTKRGKDDQNEDLRALLNVGYRNGATIPRCVGAQHEVRHFNVFAPAALAGIGDLPDTIQTRSVIIKMRRRAPGESVEAFRLREHERAGHDLRDMLAVWASHVGKKAGEAWPALPDGIVDRPAEIWEPLIAVADAAGGQWPLLARDACIELCKVASDRAVSLGVRLLADLRAIFNGAGNPEAMPTEILLRRLTGEETYGQSDDGEGLILDDAPWADLRGKPIDARGIACMLKRYEVRARKVKVGGKSLQGYRREDLFDAWQRYLPLASANVEPTEPADLNRRKPSSSAGNNSSSAVPQMAPLGEQVPEPCPASGTRDGAPLCNFVDSSTGSALADTGETEVFDA